MTHVSRRAFSALAIGSVFAPTFAAIVPAAAQAGKTVTTPSGLKITDTRGIAIQPGNLIIVPSFN